jgi:hypothetical protein
VVPGARAAVADREPDRAADRVDRHRAVVDARVFRAGSARCVGRVAGHAGV